MKPEVLFCLLGSLLLQFSGNTEAVSRQYRVLVHIASAHHTEHLDLTCHNNFDTSTPFAEFTEIVTQETVTNNGKDKVKVVVSQKNYQHRAASTDEPGPSQESQKSTPGVGTTTTTKGPANKSPLITLTTTKRPAKPAATTSKAPAATTKKLPAATAKPSTADTKQKQMFTTTTRKPARPIKTFTTTTKKLPAATAAASTTKVADKSAILTTKAPAKPAAASTPKSPAKPAAASTTKIPAKPAVSTAKIPANPVTTPAASLVTKKAIPVKPKSISLPPLKPNSVTKKPGQAATKKPLVPISMKPSIVTQKPKEMLTTTTKKAAPPTTLKPEKIAVNRFTMSVDVAGLRDLRERAMNDDDDYE
ncbi:hypothetical protein TYRP_018010 [Tyrophagus putrescentiae]|nr:hypothetical protein TYRP_018010 [Tyrophagus putrescentiae]